MATKIQPEEGEVRNASLRLIERAFSTSKNFNLVRDGRRALSASGYRHKSPAL